MTTTTTTTPNSARRFKTVRFVVLSGWALTLIVVLAPIVLAMWLYATRQPMPDKLEVMAATCLGFVFAKVFDLVQRYVNQEETEK